MYKAMVIIVGLVLASFCNTAAARYIQGDPLGIVPVPVPGAPKFPFSSGPSPMMVTTSRAITAADVLRLHQLNHSYAYVGGNPLSNTDPSGLQQFPLPASQQAAAQALQCALNPAACNLVCVCKSPQGPDPNVAGNIMGGSMLGFGTAGAVAGGVAGGTIVAGEVASAGAIGGLIAADAVASGAVAGGVVGGAVGAAVGLVAVGGYYYYTSRPGSNSCPCPCP